MYTLINFLSSTSSSSSSASTAQNQWMTYVVFGVLAVLIIVYFFFSSRQNKKRREEAEAKVNNMQLGDRVKTIGGICGTVAEINDDENSFVLKTGMAGNENYIKFDKVAIYQIEKAEAFTAPEQTKEETKIEKTANETTATEQTAEETANETETSMDAEENN